MLEVDVDTSEGVPDSTNGLDEVCMGGVTWCELLDLLNLMKCSQIIEAH